MLGSLVESTETEEPRDWVEPVEEEGSGNCSGSESPVSQKMPGEIEKYRGWEPIGLCGDL